MFAKPGLFSRSLELRLLVPLAITIAVALAIHAVIGYWGVREELKRFIRADLARSTTLIRNATHDGMLLNRMSEVQSRIENLGSSSGFTAIRVYSKDGRIALTADRSERGRVIPITDKECTACHIEGEETGEGVLRSVEMPVLGDGHEGQRSLSVIMNEASCSSLDCHPPPAHRPVLGVLDVQMTMAPFDEAINRARQQLGTTTILLIMTAGVIVAIFIRRLIHEPVERLHEGTQRIAAGDLHTTIDVSGQHDLAQLAGAFNGMVKDLRGAREELGEWSRTLERRVEEKTQELRQAQRRMTQVETMASLGKLSATVAHELNNPLGGILAYARLTRRELAEQGLEPGVFAQIDSYLRLIDRESVRCSEIVKNLLVFARGQSVRTKMVSINEIVDNSLMLVRHHLEMHKIRLEASLLDGDPTIVADQGQIQQAVLALLMNSIESMHGLKERPAVLTVRMRGDADRVEFSVQDTGVGIAPELLPHIFEPFVTTKGETSGVGLGLAVVYGVVHGHGGEITVQSKVGEGTMFTVWLPRRREAPGTVGGDGGKEKGS
ncbi:MAG: HAMP domain-containing protein [Phycisphaerales bacterium]|nr:HAMP domain-containing protein [Phycisphaerales bacterium]